MNPLVNMMAPTAAMNPMMELIMAVKSGNPRAALQSIANRNPKVKEAIEMLQGKTPQDMEAICRNLCAKRGIDFDSALANIKNMMR